MKILLPKSPFLTFIFLIANLLFANVTFGQTVSLDQADLDYAPGETVYITGTGWYPNEIINLQIDHLTQPIPDHGTPDPHLPWTVEADSSGNFTASWVVTEYELGANLLLNADGLLSGYTYEVFFTDANSVLSEPTPNSAVYGSSITISSTLTANQGGAAIAGRTISFSLNGINLGSAVTNASGIASLNVTLTMPVGNYNGNNGLKADFAGDSSNNPFSGTSKSTNFNVLASSCTMPTIICPPSPVIACNGPIPAGATTVAGFSALGGSTNATTSISYSDGVPTLVGCTETRVRTYTATSDTCVNTCTQTITRKVDTAAPTGTNPSAITGVNACLPTQPQADGAFDATLAAAGYSDNCGGVVTAEMVSAVVSGTKCSWSIQYTFKVKDECGNYTANQTYTRSGGDQTAPTGATTAGSTGTNACKSAAAGLFAFDAAAAAAGYTDNCGGFVTAIETGTEVVTGTDCNWEVTYTFKVVDGCGNELTGQTYKHTGGDKTAPTITAQFVSKTSLWPPNHKMVDIYLNASDNCGSIASSNIRITSNEPENDLGDGNTGPDWWIDPLNPLHIQLRAERSGVQALVTPDIGRIYTIEVLSLTDACGNVFTPTLPATNTVTVAHNITAPNAGKSIKLGETINLTGTFWDNPGNRHSVKWSIDGTTVNGVVTAEPSGNRAGKVSGSFKPTAAGVYKIQMNVTDQNGITSYASTNGDYEAYFVVYDPKGGYTYGAGTFISPAGAITARPNITDKVAFGFASNYVKNATNPKGETQLDLKISDGNYNFGFNALNYDYLVVNGNKAQYKGLGKTIINGVEQGGLAFVLTVIDGKNQTNPSGVDKIRLKIYNKNTGAVIYDNQPGASETDDPITAIDLPKADGTDIVVVSTSATAKVDDATTRKKVELIAVSEESKEPVPFNVTAYPNPSKSYFSLDLVGGSNEKVEIDIFDMQGRRIKHIESNNQQSIVFGEDLSLGNYIAIVTQGANKKTLKILKE